MAEMKVRPTGISLTCHSVATNFRDYVTVMVDLLTACGLPSVNRWKGKNRTGTGADLAGILAAMPETPADAGDDVSSLVLELGEIRGGILVTLLFRPDPKDTSFSTLQLRRITRKEDGATDLIAFQALCQSLCRAILHRIGIYSVELRAEGGGIDCIPEVPLVDDGSHLVVTDRDEAIRAYDDPAAFWDSGWERIDEKDGRHLLARAMDTVCGPEYLARIIDQQWALARAAKPGKTSYARPRVRPEEEPIFTAGEARLHGVGYSAEEQLQEYSCALNPGEHIRGWEIYALLNIVKGGKLSDGSPVKTVRIVFMQQWMAMQEKRPLLDVGCRVYHYADDGALRELTE